MRHPQIRVTVVVEMHADGMIEVMPSISSKPSDHHPGKAALIRHLSPLVREQALALGRIVSETATGDANPIQIDLPAPTSAAPEGPGE